MSRLILIAALLATSAIDLDSVAAQAPGPVRLRLVVQRRIGAMTTPQTFGLSGANKPNGRMYRLRQSIPDKAPDYVAREMDGLELYIADPVADGWLAFYRGAPGSDEPRNSRYVAALYGPAGERRWTLPLNGLMSRPDHLEVTDVRYAGGRLYFNESCQSYSREAGGRCSSLVRADPAASRVDWRTPPLVSNDVFILYGPWVVSGYGFTAEPDAVFVIDRETGRVLATARVDSALDYLEVKDGRLYVMTTRSLYVFEIVRGRG